MANEIIFEINCINLMFNFKLTKYIEIQMNEK